MRRGTISQISEYRVELVLGEEVPAALVADITVVLSIFKFDRMEWALEKCTELGVSRFIPLIARRTEAHLAAAAPKRVERWRRLVQQASEQSRRVAIPEIADPLKLQKVFEIPADVRILLSEVEGSLSLKESLRSYAPAQSVLLAFGPEGGWTQSEVDEFEKSGWRSASLGPTILRAETAAIAATAVVIAETQ